MNTDPEFILRKLHSQFETLTGRRYQFMMWRHDWWEFVKAGYTEDDLALVIAFANRVNQQREKRYAIQLTLAKVITDLRNFDTLRAEADLAKREREARKRQLQPTPGEIALAEMRHEEVPVKEQVVKRISLDSVVEALRGAKQ